MKIVDVEAIPFRLPVRSDFRWTGLNVSLGGFVLVRVETDEGLQGVGEATPLPDWGGDFGDKGGETQETVVEMVLRHLRPAITEMDPREPRRIAARMAQVVRGHTYAKTAIDIAVHDIAARAAGVPLHQYLGGCVRDRVAVAHMIGLMPIEDAVEEASRAHEEGARAFQVKGGESADRDVELVGLLRQTLGKGILLRLDANQGYRTVKAACTAIERLVDAGVDLVEQPVEGRRELAEVTSRASVSIIADESCWSPRDALDLATSRAADGISIYLAKAGGIAAARDVAAIADAAQFPCDINGSIESAVGTAANVHVALSTPSVTLPAVIPMNAPDHAQVRAVAGTYYTDDITTQALPSEPGHLLPPEGVGLGVEIDEDKLDMYRSDRTGGDS